MGEVIQLQGDQRKDVQEFLTDKKEGLELDVKTIKVSFNFTRFPHIFATQILTYQKGSRFLSPYIPTPLCPLVAKIADGSTASPPHGYFLPASRQVWRLDPSFNVWVRLGGVG